ncbi:unnamed protein product [Mytilus edulis]|uniref:Uncharacterized protein n=1 Tax=Mytilus edulis TaxID=6550 RepID=A0A8S3SIQ4_MYTED|nr:unnamed protein product [Mytilus edulis]
MQEQKTVIGCPGALVTTEEKLESGKKRIMQGFVVPVTLLKLRPVQLSNVTVGKITCNDVSVVDYLILSSDLFSNDKEFLEVEEFNTILSDVHCNLKFTLESQPYTNINNVKTVEKQVIKWNNNKQDKFVKFVKQKKSEGIRDIETILDKLIDRNDTVQQTDIDTAMNKICEIFNSSSISVFGTKCNQSTEVLNIG